MMVMMMMIMTFASVEQRPGWGGHVYINVVSIMRFADIHRYLPSMEPKWTNNAGHAEYQSRNIKSYPSYPYLSTKHGSRTSDANKAVKPGISMKSGF
jgi:hypothetical protein